MANITTFATLKSELLALLGRAPADFVYQVVTQEINRDMRLLEMQSTQTVAESASVALETDFSEIVSVYRDADPRCTLTPTTPHVIHSTYETSGTPSKYAVVDGNLLLNKPGDGTNLIIRYYAELALFSANDDTNEVLTEYPDVYLYGSLYHHALGIGDPRVQGWGMAFEGAKARAIKADTKARIGGAPTQPTVQGMTP